MAGLQIADIGERDELFELVWRMPRDGLQQEADVIADVEAVQYVADEPPRRVIQNRKPVRSRPPAAPGELVGLVTRLAAEQSRERAVPPRHEMHREMLSVLRHPIGVIALRQPHQEARRTELT